MSRRSPGPALVSLAAACFFALYAIIALGYSARAAAVPLAIALPALALCLLQARAELSKSVATRATSTTGGTSRLLGAWLWLVGFVAATILLGITGGLFVMIFAYLTLVPRTGPVTALLAASAFCAIIIVLIEFVLDMPLEPGLLPAIGSR